MTLNVPKDGATFKSTILSGCTITVAPTGAVEVDGQVQRQEHRHGHQRQDPDQGDRVHQHHGHDQGHRDSEPGSREASVVIRRQTSPSSPCAGDREYIHHGWAVPRASPIRARG